MFIFTDVLGLLGEERGSPCSAPKPAPECFDVALKPAQGRGYVFSSSTFYLLPGRGNPALFTLQVRNNLSVLVGNHPKAMLPRQKGMTWHHLRWDRAG